MEAIKIKRFKINCYLKIEWSRSESVLIAVSNAVKITNINIKWTNSNTVSQLDTPDHIIR